ncbi:MAG TPA: HAD-IB family hydrolase [Actinomycetota bacterium]
MTEAAFFDLDKTVIARSSTLLFGRPLYKEGLIPRATILKGAYAALVYQIVGADENKMDKMRVALLELTKGWEAEKIRQISRETLTELIEPIIYAEALHMIQMHRNSGRRVYLVSSSGDEIVRPLADYLGVPYAIGSKAEIVDGRYTGELTFYCQGEGKRTAIMEEAERHGIDLSRSYAYSDSATDIPMLETVGHPVAVNPDKELRKIATERGWEILVFRNPISLRKRIAGVPRPEPRTAMIAGVAAVGLLAAVYAYRTRASRRHA